ncbi:MAG: hypothetical protein JKY70_00750 [Mucilaginibacter sp.]|nr:hypothetical protein [Mucilaginibacter sp.]
MITTIRLNFTLKNTKLLANGTGPIYARITLNGERVVIYLLSG